MASVMGIDKILTKLWKWGGKGGHGVNKSEVNPFTNELKQAHRASGASACLSEVSTGGRGGEAPLNNEEWIKRS